VMSCCSICAAVSCLLLRSFPTRRSSDLCAAVAQEDHVLALGQVLTPGQAQDLGLLDGGVRRKVEFGQVFRVRESGLSDPEPGPGDRKSTRLNSSHVKISYAVFCLKKKKS